MARTCLCFAVADAGTIVPNALRRLVAAAIERSCCKAMGTWEWVGYIHHVSEKQKPCVAGM